MENIDEVLHEIEETLVDEVYLLHRILDLVEKSKLNAGILLIEEDGTRKHLKFESNTQKYTELVIKAEARLAEFRAAVVQ